MLYIGGGIILQWRDNEPCVHRRVCEGYDREAFVCNHGKTICLNCSMFGKFEAGEITSWTIASMIGHGSVN